jgi:hypothetical protein
MFIQNIISVFFLFRYKMNIELFQSDDVIYEQLMHLTIREILEYRFVSKRMNDLISSDVFWCRLLKRDRNIDETVNCRQRYEIGESMYVITGRGNLYLYAAFDNFYDAEKYFKDYVTKYAPHSYDITLGSIRFGDYLYNIDIHSEYYSSYDKIEIDQNYTHPKYIGTTNNFYIISTEDGYRLETTTRDTITFIKKIDKSILMDVDLYLMKINSELNDNIARINFHDWDGHTNDVGKNRFINEKMSTLPDI